MIIKKEIYIFNFCDILGMDTNEKMMIYLIKKNI